MPSINLDEYYFKKIALSALILIGSFIASLVLKKAIDLIVGGMKRKVANRYILAKTQTIRSLLKNLSDGLLFGIAILIILAHWGLEITPILTGAGILGLAFSFGAQTFVKDLIAGFFIVIEDQFNIGDTIKTGTYQGEVVKMTLRITILRDKKGNIIFIPNSQIATVVKLTQPNLT